MKIRVQDVDKRAAGYFVHFSCLYGSGQAAWHGPVPDIGREYCVDIECGELVIWGETVYPVKSRMCRMRSSRDCLRITGLLVLMNRDGTAALRLCNDLVILKVKGTPPSPDTYVEFRACDVILRAAGL